MDINNYGGESGIRTHGPVINETRAFQARSFGLSDISPRAFFLEFNKKLKISQTDFYCYYVFIKLKNGFLL
jgi:hypothetical protein